MPERGDWTPSVTPEEVRRASEMARGGGVMGRRREATVPEQQPGSDGTRAVFVCPECASAAFTPFSCGGPHRYIRKDGLIGKRRVYRFVEAVEYVPRDGAAWSEDARAEVIRELRDAATDQGPQSAYWLAADYLERK